MRTIMGGSEELKKRIDIDFRKVINSINNSIHNLSRKKEGILCSGRGCLKDVKKDLTKLTVYKDILQSEEQKKLSGLRSCLCDEDLQKLIEKTPINCDSIYNDFWIDDSERASWEKENKGCRSNEYWEKASYTFCENYDIELVRG